MATAVRRAPAPAQVDIPARLKAWRTHFDLTFEAVAEPARVSRQAVQQIEAGRSHATMDTLQAIVTKGLGMTLAEFCSRGPKDATAGAAR